MLGSDVSEDCLYLNIWSGALGHEPRAPVYVYVHGGAFTGGSGDVSVYDGENLARRGIIVITLNYRLGVLGFLAHPALTKESPHHSSGNYGLLDQLAALRWVSQNIAAFGGDAKRITVGGQSAGALSVSFLVASPLTKDIFAGAVAESGSSVINFPLPTLPVAEHRGEDYAKSKGTDSIERLRDIPWQKLITSPSPTKASGSPPDPAFSFSPILDGWFLRSTPADAFAQPQQNDVATMTGWNADDYFGRPADADTFRKQAERRYGSFAQEFLRLYPAGSNTEALASYKEASRDRNRVAMYLWASARAKTAGMPAYTYFFTHAIPWPEHPEFGAFHTGEVPYIFDNLDRLPRPWKPEDREFAHEFSSFLINFVSTGNPNGAGLPKWAAFNPASKMTMEIGDHSGPMPLASGEKEQFWVRYLSSPESAKAPFI